MRTLLARAAIVALVVTATCVTSCKTVVQPTTQAVIDCLAQDHLKLEQLADELKPLLYAESPDWELFKKKVYEAGIAIGGCVAAELIQVYLAPAPGHAAPALGPSIDARQTFEEIRAKFNGVMFKTQHGTL